jgi:hypothetical protein
MVPSLRLAGPVATITFHNALVANRLSPEDVSALHEHIGTVNSHEEIVWPDIVLQRIVLLKLKLKISLKNPARLIVQPPRLFGRINQNFRIETGQKERDSHTYPLIALIYQDK